ncbi:MAG: hypothetical protein K0S41_2510 [Anaerocolumna sp.]|jgi:hypothetical protein|nr:hypothetical protein [Anaerocolumna sp.]
MKVLRKIVIMTMILAFSGMALGGCGKNDVKTPGDTITNAPTKTPDNVTNEDQVDTPDDTTNETPTDTSTDNSDENLSEEPEEVIKEGTIEKNGNVVLKQLAFMYNGSAIAISDIVDEKFLENILGKADEIKSHTYSYDDGLNMDQLNGMTEKQYLYPGLVIKTIETPEDKKPIIFNIEITDSKYPTVRNIKVGDSYEKLKEAYPEGNLLGGEISNEEDDFRYEPVNYVDIMTFHIKDKKVDSILIYSLLD